MKKVFFLLAVVLGSMLLNAQTNQMVWNNGLEDIGVWMRG